MDLSRIRLLRDDVAVWLVYAGRGRRYFDFFRDNGLIFLSLPGFAASPAVFASEDTIRQHLAMSDAIGKWARGGQRVPPSRTASAYQAYPYAAGSSEAKSLSADVGNVNRMFVHAKAGDLVLCPPYGHYDPFLIGEITHEWRKADDIVVPMLMGETVPTRRVRWLDTVLAKRDFAPKVSRRLQNQHAITQMSPDLYRDIFNRVYPGYVWGDYSKLDIFGDSYTGTDPLQTYPSAILIKYVIASVFAFDKGEFDKFQALDPNSAISTYYDQTLVEDFGQNFNSPGKFSVIAALGSLAILTAGGLYVATSDTQQPFNQTQNAAKSDIKGSIEGDGKKKRSDELDNYVDSMKAVDWKKVQKDLGEPAKSTLDLSLSNKVELARHRAELNAK